MPHVRNNVVDVDDQGLQPGRRYGKSGVELPQSIGHCLSGRMPEALIPSRQVWYSNHDLIRIQMTMAGSTATRSPGILGSETNGSTAAARGAR